MSVELRDQVVREFKRRFGGQPPLVVRAPGRVNLIGDHTDYNDGFVLPMAIDREVWLAIRARDDNRITVRSINFEEDATFAANDRSHGDGWVEYIRGIAWALEAEGQPTRGWDGVVGGDVPLGAGLSSSAALELAAARAFAAVGGIAWHPAAMARLAQRAENQWVGVNCGIMDQLISAAGAAGHALLIDCRTLETRPVPVPDKAAVIVLDTGTRRGLVDSAYNERRAQCERAARHFGVRALRDVDPVMFTARASELDDLTRRRARHVITENARTTEAAAQLDCGDTAKVGALMNDSHVSLRDDFEVSRHELDVMVAIAQEHDACFGARMTGAGFGGCAVALIDRDGVSDFRSAVPARYAQSVGLQAAVYVCQPSEGASVESLA